MNNSKSTKENLIHKYDLDAHPEGGWYKEIYRSESLILSPVNNKKRNTVTHIYFLLGKGDISRFHSVLHDEIWNFYDGAPIRLIQFDKTQIKEKVIGPGCKDYTVVIKGGVYQAAVSTGSYTLVGCTVAPGFDFTDFSFLLDNKQDMKKFDPFYSTYRSLL